ncbi:ATP-binding protein, partial [Kitasatospora sp. NPDC056783]|uniref:ATP-binding protein n=1 Tax=Kitasatospora sp. NPDC056783 TaxID=3345943 RepID=UPI0036843505
MTRPQPVDPVREQALALAGLLERVRARVARRTAELAADDPTADDPLRGLYLSEEAVGRLLALPGPGPGSGSGSSGVAEVGALESFDTFDAFDARAAFAPPEPSGHGPTDALVARFGLGRFDREILLLALAPDLDRRFAGLYGYLNDDVGRRRATIGLVLDLCGCSSLSGPARARLAAGAPLLTGRTLIVEHTERPFLERELRVPDEVCRYLLGGPGAPAPLHAPQPPPGADPRPAGALRARPDRPLHLRCPDGEDGEETALWACSGAGRPVLRLDPGRAVEDPAADGPAETVAVALREARLRGATLLLGPLPAGAERPWVRAAVEPETPAGAAVVPLVLFGGEPFDPAWTDAPLLALSAGRPPLDRAAAWRAALRTADAGTSEEAGGSELAPEVVAAAGAYRMAGARIRQAARDAVDLAAADGVPLSARHLHEAARLRNATGLDRYARRVRPAVDLSDLVLPPEPSLRVRELVQRARHREQVLRDWRMRRGGGRGNGVVAVFTGESGTGKTMAAEAVAAALGLDLYVVELSSVVDKYVGETEKNLDRIFGQAADVNAVLLFDEADAVFGKRSEVRDSHDRYANMESAYLLQRLESFDGVAVLTTNLRGNIDEAFTRRFDVMVEFPAPDEAGRRALWEHCLRPPLPVAGDIDVAALARDFD